MSKFVALLLAWLICTWTVLGTLPSLPFFTFYFYYILFILLFFIHYYFTWNGPKMFVDLDWPTNASSPLSASAELLVDFMLIWFYVTVIVWFMPSCNSCIFRIFYRIFLYFLYLFRFLHFSFCCFAVLCSQFNWLVPFW